MNRKHIGQVDRSRKIAIYIEDRRRERELFPSLQFLFDSNDRNKKEHI